MPGLRIKLLGGFEARFASGVPLVLPARKTEALLAYLALSPGRAQRRDKLTALLWPDAADRQARQNLRQALFHLRQAFRAGDETPPPLIDERERVALHDALVDVDATEFERLARSATAADLERAATMYQGDLLAGLVVKSSGFEEWLMAERARLHELAVEAMASLMALLSHTGEVERAIQAGGRLLVLDPMQEAVHRSLMRLYVRAGRRDAALRQYRTCLDVLQRELGTEPEAETRQIYEQLVRQGPGRGSGKAGAISSPPIVPIVGRHREIGALTSALAAAWQGSPSVAVVLGEAGAGKTRLIDELVTSARREGGRVLAGRAYEMERVLPFAPWVSALRSAREPGDETALGALTPTARRHLQLLVPEVQDGSPPPASIDSSLPLFDAVTELLGELARKQPLLVVLDDLHWADEQSLRLLAYVARRVGEAPLLVLAGAREEELVDVPMLGRLFAELDAERRITTVPLSRLTRRETIELVVALGRHRASAPRLGRLAERVWQDSEGNPFMAVEMVRALDHVRRARPSGARPLPERVRQLITGRLDRLSEAGRDLVAAAAVLGSGLAFPLLQRVARLDDRAAARAAEELVRRRILDHAGEDFQFDHDRIQQVAYDRLLPAERRALHAAAAEAIEAFCADRLEDVHDRLAHHYARAGRASETVTSLERFADTARRRGALGDAVRALEEALARLVAMPAPDERLRVELALRHAQLVSILGRFQEVFDALVPLGPSVERLDDPRLTGLYCFRLAMTFANVGRHEEALAAATRSLEAGRRACDDGAVGRAHYVLAITGFSTGRFADGADDGRRAVALLEPSGELLWAGQANWILGLNLAMLGEFAGALAALARVDVLAEALGDRVLEGFAAYSTALVQLTRGDVDAAQAAAERGIARAPDPSNRATAQAMLGYALLERGDVEQAVALLETALGQLTRFEIRQSITTLFLADALLRSGADARAREVAARGIATAERIGFLWGVAWGERLLGRLLLAAGDAAAAERSIEQATHRFREAGCRFEVAVTGLDQAAVAYARGREAEAVAWLAEARTALSTFDVPVWLERADRLAARLGLGAPPRSP